MGRPVRPAKPAWIGRGPAATVAAGTIPAVTAYERLPTDIDGLDLLLDGGLRYPRDGSIFLVILGGPGSGKTHLALEIAVRTLRRLTGNGGSHVFYSLDQTPAELHAKLREDFGFFQMPGEWGRIVGAIENPDHAAIVQSYRPAGAEEHYLALAALREPPRELVLRSGALFERLDADIAALTREAAPVGTHLKPRLVAIDNISIAALGDDGAVRTALHQVRDHLAARNLHGIFVIETPGGAADQAAFTAAEYAADVIVHLGYHAFGDQFKERSIEIAKARHQFYYRGTHHFSIVGRNEGRLRGARGQRPPGIHVYPSVPTLLSHLAYRDGGAAPAATESVPFGLPDLSIPAGSVSGLVGPPQRAIAAHRLALRFLLAEPADGLLISFRESEPDLRAVASKWLAREELERLQILAFAPEYLSTGKFLKDVFDAVEQLRERGRSVKRAALWGLGHLRWAFPLLSDARMLLPWMAAFFRQEGITSLFVEATRVPVSARPAPGDPVGGESAVATTVDHLFEIVERGDGGDDLVLIRSLSARGGVVGALPVPAPRT
jgi:KaiC/GvpD/RAD55 family RecA-like ATPase